MIIKQNIVVKFMNKTAIGVLNKWQLIVSFIIYDFNYNKILLQLFYFLKPI